ncbi:MAG: hypothetical protein WCJ66_12590 [Verrucomicrobiota bacterium]
MGTLQDWLDRQKKDTNSINKNPLEKDAMEGTNPLEDYDKVPRRTNYYLLPGEVRGDMAFGRAVAIADRGRIYQDENHKWHLKVKAQ